VSALFAGAVALFSTNPPERLWGILAAGPYAAAAIAALPGRRGPAIAVVVSLAGALIVPLAWMAWSGQAQPEVSVVIHSAGLFLHQGTPYPGAHALATAHNPYVYNPYLPALAVFGVPHALFGGGLLTDPRLWFGVVFVLGFAGTLALSGVPRPWLWTAVVAASPVIAFPLTTGGDDLPVLALLCVGLALLRPGQAPRPTQRIILAGLALGLAAAMKATAWPALAVALALVADCRAGRRGRPGPDRPARRGGVEHDPVPTRAHQDQEPGGQLPARPPDRRGVGAGAPGGDRAGPAGGARGGRVPGAPAAPGRARGGLAAGDRAGADVRLRPGQPVRLRCLPARHGLLAAAGGPGRGGRSGWPADTTGRSRR
jgi:hypothetical protein